MTEKNTVWDIITEIHFKICIYYTQMIIFTYRVIALSKNQQDGATWPSLSDDFLFQMW